MRGEDALRIEDFHYFINSRKVSSNPKAILWSPHRLSDVLILWTRLQDQNYERSRAQFGFKEEAPPALIIHENKWRDFRFDVSYGRTKGEQMLRPVRGKHARLPAAFMPRLPLLACVARAALEANT